MAGKESVDRQDIEKLDEILDEKKCILFGGASLLFYGISRGTKDVDVELINGTTEQALNTEKLLNSANIPNDVTNNSSGWGMIPLPKGYQDRAIQTELKNIKVLNPLDFVLSKMRRGTEIDQKDCLAVCKAQKVSGKEISKHLELVDLPSDPASQLFIKRLKFLTDAMEKKTTNKN